MPSLLFLGGNGYIGSCVFDTLLNAHPGIEYAALVRSPEHVAHIAGNHCIQGSLDDLDNVEKLASGADIVINVANSDNVPLIHTIVKGLKKRKAETGGKVAFVHTSGLKVFMEGNEGKKLSLDAKLWDDGDEENIKSISPELPHGPTDLAVLEAGLSGEVATYIVCPALVYGKSPSGKCSNFYRAFIGGAVKAGAVSVVGEGSNTLGMVHIEDLANVYLRIVDEVLSQDTPTTSPYARYYIASSFERDMRTIASGISEQLRAHGLLPTAELRSLTPEQIGPLASFLGGSARFRARRAREDLGWSPTESEWENFTERDVEDALIFMGINYKHQD